MANKIRKIHLIPYYHHDYAWCNTRSWHIWRYIKAFEKTLDLMKANQKLTLTVDNILHSIREFENYCPKRIEEFGALVREGRICVSNGGMALIRPGLFDGELYIRNITDGMREFTRLFGIKAEDMPTFWNADGAPGHSQMPQIMSQIGCRMYRFKRPEASLDRSGVPEVFRWKGLDGSSVIVERTSYSIGWSETFEELSADNWTQMRESFINEHLKARLDRINTEDIIAPFGGDDRMPLENYADITVNIDALISMWNSHEDSVMEYSTPDRFLKAVENTELPEYSGTLDQCELSFNAPFRADRSLWRARFEAERLILLCERLDTILEAIGGTIADASFTKRLWERSYEFCGHAMQFLLDEDYTKVLESAHATVTLAREYCLERQNAIASLAGGGVLRRHVLINPSSFDYDGLAELHITSERQVSGLRLYDCDGNELTWQLTKIYQYMNGFRSGQYSEVKVVCPVRIPQNGYGTVFVDFDGEKMPDIPKSFDAETLDIDAGYIRCRIENGNICDLVVNGKRALENVPLIKLRFVETRPTDSWYTDFESTGEAEFQPTACRVNLNGPLRWEIEINGTLSHSEATLVAIVEKENPEITFHLTLDSHEKEGFFIADFPCDKNPELHAGIPFGEEERDASKVYYTERKPGSPMSFIDFERGWKGQLWANGYLRMKQTGIDAAVMQGDCDVYYQNIPQSGRLSLLLMKCINIDARSDRWVREMSRDTCGSGIQHFTFGICYPNGDCAYELKKAVDRFRLPIKATDRYCLEYGNAPYRFSLFSLFQEGICVTSVRSEKNKCYIRLYESLGKERYYRLDYYRDIICASFTDLLDRPVAKTAEYDKRSVSFQLKAWEIATLLIESD